MNVTSEMAVVSDEVFGPVMVILPVSSDADALAKMNASPFGLTASLWTRNVEAASHLTEQLEFGTVFLNRCDYLDPALPWSGVKDSGKGVSLSTLGFDAFVRVKSWHFRLPA